MQLHSGSNFYIYIQNGIYNSENLEKHINQANIISGGVMVEATMNKCMEGQRILDLCKAVREIHGYNSPQIALSWIRLIEETEEPLKLTSREFIKAIKEMAPDVQNAYLKTIRNTGDIDMLTNVSFMSELKKMGKDDAINRLKSIMRRY